MRKFGASGAGVGASGPLAPGQPLAGGHHGQKLMQLNLSNSGGAPGSTA